MTLIGTASLWRGYRTTVRLYTGDFTGGKKAAVAVPVSVSAAPATPMRPAYLLEMKFPWIPEQAAAIAVGGFRSLTRAPEAKMMLLTPVILVVVFGGMFWRGVNSSINLPDAVRPLLGFAAMTIILFSMVSLIGNQFSFDRGGFRVFVLCPAPRRDILLGKNLAVVPLALVLCIVPVALVQIVFPMRVDHFLALAPQFVSMFLLFCILANMLSMLAPLHIPAGP